MVERPVKTPGRAKGDGLKSRKKVISKKRRYGWIPDVPDRRDLLYRAPRPRRLRLPPSVDLRRFCPPVENQGSLGSCTANALAGNIEFLDEKDGSGYTDVSRLFIYYNERVIEHSVSFDAGAMLRDGIKSLSKQGVCSEATWPYDVQKFAVKPAPPCYREARQHVIQSYFRILTIGDMLTCLSDGFPFVFGFAVYEGFEGRQVAETGVVSMPSKDERQLGGHAVLAVGFDQSSRRFIVRNSWGTGWGMSGYFTMPFEYLETLADDFWTIRK